jgi:hypothetical protein
MHEEGTGCKWEMRLRETVEIPDRSSIDEDDELDFGHGDGSGGG